MIPFPCLVTFFCQSLSHTLSTNHAKLIKLNIPTDILANGYKLAILPERLYSLEALDDLEAALAALKGSRGFCCCKKSGRNIY